MKSGMTSCLMILALAVFAMAAPSVADEPWPAFRGPGTTGVSAEQLPEGDGPLAFELVWKRPLGSAYSGISIAEGLLVTGYSDGEHDFVGAFDPETGEEVWHHAFAPHYKGHDGSHDGSTATPSISAGRVFMASPWGHLVALDLATGEPLWTRHMIDDFGGEKPLYGFAASPLVVGDSVVMSVCSEKESIVALDAGSGDVVWRSLDRPCGGISECTDRMALNLVRDVNEQVDVRLHALPLVDTRQHAIQPTGSFAARRTLPTGFCVIESRDAAQDADHAGRLIHYDHRAGPQA